MSQQHGDRCPRFSRDAMPRGLRIAGLVAIGIVGIVVFAVVFGLLVRWLWNAVASPVLGLRQITYWQALGLTILARLLFGGLGFNGAQSRARRRSRQRPAAEDGAGVEPTPAGPGPSDYERYWREEGQAAFAAYLQREEQGKKGAGPG